jgi:hypothetical protein
MIEQHIDVIVISTLIVVVGVALGMLVSMIVEDVKRRRQQ